MVKADENPRRRAVRRGRGTGVSQPGPRVLGRTSDELFRKRTGYRGGTVAEGEASRPTAAHGGAPAPAGRSTQSHDDCRFTNTIPPQRPRRSQTPAARAGSRTHCAETRVAGKPPDPGPDGRRAAPRPRTGPTRDARSAGHSLTRRVARTEPGPLGAWICTTWDRSARRSRRTAPERKPNRYRKLAILQYIPHTTS